MKKVFLIVTVFIALGAGCSKYPSKAVSVLPSGVENVSTKGAENPSVPAEATSTFVSTSSTTDLMPEPVFPEAALLKELPELASLAEPIDDTDWSSKSTPYPVVTLRYPSTGLYSVSWNSKMLKKDDSNIQGGCYVNARTIYKKTDIPGYAVDVCQTVTDFSAQRGIRTDYFVMGVDDEFRLIAFTKPYREDFDMNMYGAVIAHVIGILD